MTASLLQLRKKFQTKTADCDPTALIKKELYIM